MVRENCDLISEVQQLAGKILSARELAPRFSASLSRMTRTVWNFWEMRVKVG
jgi:hypothetical protein